MQPQRCCNSVQTQQQQQQNSSLLVFALKVITLVSLQNSSLALDILSKKNNYSEINISTLLYLCGLTSVYTFSVWALKCFELQSSMFSFHEWIEKTSGCRQCDSCNTFNIGQIDIWLHIHTINCSVVQTWRCSGCLLTTHVLRRTCIDWHVFSSNFNKKTRSRWCKKRKLNFWNF